MAAAANRPAVAHHRARQRGETAGGPIPSRVEVTPHGLLLKPAAAAAKTTVPASGWSPRFTHTSPAQLTLIEGPAPVLS